ARQSISQCVDHGGSRKINGGQSLGAGRVFLWGGVGVCCGFAAGGGGGWGVRFCCLGVVGGVIVMGARRQN
ncbi:hypothetical protein ACJBS5_10975, partial [Streptococcus suis]